MARVTLDSDKDHLVTPKHSDARGPVVRGKSIEVMQMNWRAGESAPPHQHPEEQAIYVISGRMRMTVGGETYEVSPGSQLPSFQCAPRRARRGGHGGDQLQEHCRARLSGHQDAVAGAAARAAPCVHAGSKPFALNTACASGDIRNFISAFAASGCVAPESTPAA